MTLFNTVTRGPTAGDYDRVSHRTLEEAMCALDNLPSEQAAHSHLEIIRGDFYWKVSNLDAIFRRFEETPC